MNLTLTFNGNKIFSPLSGTGTVLNQFATLNYLNIISGTANSMLDTSSIT